MNLSLVVAEEAIKTLSAFGVGKLIESIKSATGQDLEKVMNAPSGQEAVRIFLDYIKRNNGIPNENILKVMTEVFKKCWSHEYDDLISAREIQFLAKVSILEPNELLVLFMAYKLGKKEHDNNEIRRYHFWEKEIEILSGLNYPELVQEARIGLQRKRLLLPEENLTPDKKNKGWFSCRGEKRGNLTGLGYAIVDLVYDRVKNTLTKMDKEDEEWKKAKM
jgi:hypothetical protein